MSVYWFIGIIVSVVMTVVCIFGWATSRESNQFVGSISGPTITVDNFSNEKWGDAVTGDMNYNTAIGYINPVGGIWLHGLNGEITVIPWKDVPKGWKFSDGWPPHEESK